ncbi:MAG: 1-deoxy-D-xylulose-5-phosphate synthase, partial [Lachnospiraceae bacterium]|nr:1-deoxy-D-xylulose-5-phosphate synthase [Lachnospiraceae bacterium]
MVSKKSKLLYEEEDIVLLAKGEQSKTARAVRRRLKEIGYSCSLLEVGSKASVDQEMIRFLSEEHRLFVTMEAEGSLGAQIQDVVSGQGLPGRVLVIAVPDAYAKDSLQTLPSEEADMDIE